MKLYHSPTSPYVRKVVACAIARGIEGQIQPVPTNPHESPAALLADNPLSKVPCLVTDDGVSLCDSPLICEYLDSVGEVNPMVPARGAARWRAQRFHALSDGMLDAAVLSRGESQRPQEAARDAVIARQKAAILRTLDVLEQDPPALHLDIGTIAVACALGYLDLRFAPLNWRDGRPKLTRWFADISKEPALAQTAPI